MDKNNIISIQELLKGRNWDAEFDKTNNKRIKLVRHSGNVLNDSSIFKKYKGSISDLYRKNYKLFLEWQMEQSYDDMNEVDYLVVFLGEEQYECRFIGVFRNYGLLKYKRKITKGKDVKKVYVYDLRELKSFEVFKDRVVIGWGKGRNWIQGWHNTKELKRIEQVNDKDDVPYFTRYEDVRLNMSQLNKVVKNKEWQSRLRCVNCVYLILDKANGKQYVGVTYKDVNDNNEVKNGILNRWTQYAQNGHGGDKRLEDLLAAPPKGQGLKYAENNFQWSILEILPLNVAPKVAIEREKLYKKKLGTREHGYNEN